MKREIRFFQRLSALSQRMSNRREEGVGWRVLESFFPSPKWSTRERRVGSDKFLVVNVVHGFFRFPGVDEVDW